MEPLSPHGLLHRRGLLRWSAAGLGASWCSAVSRVLAQEPPRRTPAQSLIVLWLQGGPSQLDTFDPQPGTRNGGDVRAIDTAARGVRLASGFERLAEQMASVSLVRSMVSREGDHERGTYAVKTGHVPDPTVVYPSIGAVCCHQLAVGTTEIPRHISILPSQWPGHGGLLGAEFDAFKVDDPASRLADVSALVGPERDQRRLRDLDVAEAAFVRGRRTQVDATLHRATVDRARRMMTSDQLRAFDLAEEPARLRAEYGDHAFGRACLAARRLVAVGVRCVEVTLAGWDTHVDNFNLCRQLVQQLDPALAALLRDLREREMLARTVVLVAGEFGRTPRINALEGRDHWPQGFSLALAGGSLRGGQVIGATDPEGQQPPTSPTSLGDVHATILHALGIDPTLELRTAIGRTVRLAEGQPLAALTSN